MFKLKISFGGLCLFVQKTTSPNAGLHVLLPKTGMPGMTKHCPTLIYKASGTTEWRPLTRSESYLGLPVPKPDINRPLQIMDMSKYAGGADVDSGCFNGTNVNLAFSFCFPLGTPVTPAGKTAWFTVPAAAPAATEDLEFSSLAEITFDVPDLEGRGFNINNVTLQPADGEIALIIANALPDHFYGVVAEARVGCPAKHIPTYYDLMLNPKPDPNRPIRHAEYQSASGPSADPTRDCPDEISHPGSKLSDLSAQSDMKMFFGDPANCTVGWGCPAYPCP